MTDSEDALRAALEAAGLSVQGIPKEQRAMFTPLTEEEVSRLIKLCAGQPATEQPGSTSPEATESASHGQPNGDC